MRKSTILTIILVLALLIGARFYFGCPLDFFKGASTGDTSAKILNAQLKIKKWRNNDCQSDTLECAIVRVHYIQFEDSIRKGLASRFNDTITSLLQNAFSDSPVTNEASLPIELAAKQFLDDYDEENAINPSYPWSMDVFVDILHQTTSHITLQERISSYTGGAHPNSYIKTHNYITETAQLLALNDIIEHQDQFMRIAEKAFRQSNDMKEEDQFYDKGFYMDSLFVISRNFALEKNGLSFLYNPYEIAPYAMGTIEFLIPYKQLDGILKPEFIPSN